MDRRRRKTSAQGIQHRLSCRQARKPGETRPPFGGRTVAEAVAPIVVEHYRNHASRWAVGRHIIAEIGDVLVSELDGSHIARVEKSFAHCGRTSRRAYAQQLRWFARALHLQGAPDLERLVTQPVREAPRQTRPTEEELKKAMNVPNLALRWVLLCGAEAGLRSGTSMRLRRMDIADGRLKVVTKFGQIADIPLSEGMTRILGALPPDLDPASPLPIVQLLEGSDRPPSINAMHCRWGEAKRKLGIRPHLVFHDFRRGLAHRMYAATGDIRDVQALLAHKNLNSTLTYLQAAGRTVSLDLLNRALSERPKQ